MEGLEAIECRCCLALKFAISSLSLTTVCRFRVKLSLDALMIDVLICDLHLHVGDLCKRHCIEYGLDYLSGSVV